MFFTNKRWEMSGAACAEEGPTGSYRNPTIIRLEKEVV